MTTPVCEGVVVFDRREGKFKVETPGLFKRLATPTIFGATPKMDRDRQLGLLSLHARPSGACGPVPEPTSSTAFPGSMRMASKVKRCHARVPRRNKVAGDFHRYAPTARNWGVRFASETPYPYRSASLAGSPCRGGQQWDREAGGGLFPFPTITFPHTAVGGSITAYSAADWINVFLCRPQLTW